jgi:hypothetical protein
MDPLDGVEDVPWDELLTTSEEPATGARVIAELRALADGGTWTDRLSDLLIEDADYFYTEWGTDCGYGPAAAPVLRFLARIAAAHPSDETTVAVLDHMVELVSAPVDREGASPEEIDNKIDTVREVLCDSRGLLREAAGHVPARADAVDGLLAGSYSGAYEPRWRGIARELAGSCGYRVDVVRVAQRTLIDTENGLLDPDTGEQVYPPPSSTGLTLRADWRGWLRRHVEAGRSRTVRQPIGGARDRVLSFPLDGRTYLVRLDANAVRRVDAGTREEIGAPIPVAQPVAACVLDLDGPVLAVASGRQIHLFDAVSGERTVRALSGHRRALTDLAVADLDGRPTLFSVDGVSLRRWDARTGTPWPAASHGTAGDGRGQEP